MLPVQRRAFRVPPPASRLSSVHLRRCLIIVAAGLLLTIASSLGAPRADHLMLSSGAAGSGLGLVLLLSTLTTLIQRARDAAETERARVVRDLHDGAQQRLVHAVITLKLAQRALQTGGDAELLIDEALLQAEQAISELRELAHGVQPPAVTQGGLRAGVESLVAHTPMRVVVDVRVRRLPAALETNAYFIVAEALTNVVKHARASAAVVRSRVVDGGLHIEVRDDGIGGARIDGGPGLRGLRERAESLGGVMRVESPMGGGTLVTVRLPLPTERIEPSRTHVPDYAPVA